MDLRILEKIIKNVSVMTSDSVRFTLSDISLVKQSY